MRLQLFHPAAHLAVREPAEATAVPTSWLLLRLGQGLLEGGDFLPSPPHSLLRRRLCQPRADELVNGLLSTLSVGAQHGIGALNLQAPRGTWALSGTACACKATWEKLLPSQPD